MTKMTTRKEPTNGVKLIRPVRLMSTYGELNELLASSHVQAISFAYDRDEDVTACYLWRGQHKIWTGRVKGIDASAALSQALEKLDKEAK